MKNILIPTTLCADTVSAVKWALQQSNGKSCCIVLLQLTESTETFSTLQRLRSMRNELTISQHEILDLCRGLVLQSGNGRLQIQTQYTLSGPLLKNFMETFQIGLAILTPSFKLSAKSINHYCIRLLSNYRVPILHLGANHEEQEFNKAMYLQRSHSGLKVEDLQQLLRDQFSFRIVSQANVPDGQDAGHLEPLISETIAKNKINLLVETRKPERIKLKKKEKEQLREILGLPILSLYEEIA